MVTVGTELCWVWFRNLSSIERWYLETSSMPVTFAASKPNLTPSCPNLEETCSSQLANFVAHPSNQILSVYPIVRTTHIGAFRGLRVVVRGSALTHRRPLKPG